MAKQISIVVLQEAIKQLPKGERDQHYIEVEVEDILLRRNPAMKQQSPKSNNPSKPDMLKLVFMYDAALKEWILII